MSGPAGRLDIRLTRANGAVTACVQRPPALSAERLFAGRTPQDAAALAPLIWNICAGAQTAAACSALGLPVTEQTARALHAETAREHALKLCVQWPRTLGLQGATRAVAVAGAAVGDPLAAQRLRAAVFAPLVAPPADWANTRAWMLAGQTPAAQAFAAVAGWDSGWGRAETPLMDRAAPPDWPAPTQRGRAVDNSVAALWATHPLMQEIEALRGRGLIWRMMARLLDLDRLLDDPPAPLLGAGAARAARGAMLARARVEDGRVTRFQRLSPTDFLLAEGGLLDGALASLPAAPGAPLRAVAAMTLDVLDPCAPLSLEIADA